MELASPEFSVVPSLALNAVVTFVDSAMAELAAIPIKRMPKLCDSGRGQLIATGAEIDGEEAQAEAA